MEAKFLSAVKPVNKTCGKSKYREKNAWTGKIITTNFDAIICDPFNIARN